MKLKMTLANYNFVNLIMLTMMVSVSNSAFSGNTELTYSYFQEDTVKQDSTKKKDKKKKSKKDK